jgi:hypothetical protein
MATIFRKTDKGLSEIETRAHRLPPRLRAALIMVDGKRSSDELRALIPAQADETLAALLEQGYIDKLAEVAAAPPKPAVSIGVPSRLGASSLPPDTTRGSEFTLLRRQLVREFNDLTGPTGEVLAIRLEKAVDRQALSTLLPAAGEFIASVRGAAKANEFRQRFADQLEFA